MVGGTCNCADCIWGNLLTGGLSFTGDCEEWACVSRGEKIKVISYIVVFIQRRPNIMVTSSGGEKEEKRKEMEKKKELENNRRIERRDHSFQICMLISYLILLLNKMFTNCSVNMDS